MQCSCHAVFVEHVSDTHSAPIEIVVRKKSGAIRRPCDISALGFLDPAAERTIYVGKAVSEKSVSAAMTNVRLKELA